MKFLFLIFYIFFVFSFYGQNEKEIFGNKNNTVFFHFQTPISSAYVGNDDYIFMFDNKNNAKLGVLKILTEKTKPTNLLITTKSGLMYSYILKYKENLSTFNYFIHSDEAINYESVKQLKESHIIDDSKNKVENKLDSINNKISIKKIDTSYNTSNISNVKNLYLYNKEKYFEKQAMNYINSKPFYFKSVVAKNNIIFRLINIKYNHNELYFVFEIKNKSLMDLDIDMLIYEITSKSTKLRASSQSIQQSPIYNYQSPLVVKGNTTIRFVAVFDKFTIGKNKVLLTSIKEKNGERDINLSISQRQINKPN